MYKVFKYPVPLVDEFLVELPVGAKILKIECQCDEPFIWALVNPENQTEKRKFRIAGTGHPINEHLNKLEHVDTFQWADGMFVWHIFEIFE